MPNESLFMQSSLDFENKINLDRKRVSFRFVETWFKLLFLFTQMRNNENNKLSKNNSRRENFENESDWCRFSKNWYKIVLACDGDFGL